MSKLLRQLIVSISLLSMVQAPAALAQSQTDSQAEKVFEGALTKVDPAAHSLTAKGASGAEVTFNYTDETQVTGNEKSVEGLISKPGARLRITYAEHAGKLVATKIEMLEITV